MSPAQAGRHLASHPEERAQWPRRLFAYMSLRMEAVDVSIELLHQRIRLLSMYQEYMEPSQWGFMLYKQYKEKWGNPLMNQGYVMTAMLEDGNVALGVRAPMEVPGTAVEVIDKMPANIIPGGLSGSIDPKAATNDLAEVAMLRADVEMLATQHQNEATSAAARAAASPSPPLSATDASALARRPHRQRQGSRDWDVASSRSGSTNVGVGVGVGFGAAAAAPSGLVATLVDAGGGSPGIGIQKKRNVFDKNVFPFLLFAKATNAQEVSAQQALCDFDSLSAQELEAVLKNNPDLIAVENGAKIKVVNFDKKLVTFAWPSTPECKKMQKYYINLKGMVLSLANPEFTGAVSHQSILGLRTSIENHTLVVKKRCEVIEVTEASNKMDIMVKMLGEFHAKLKLFEEEMSTKHLCGLHTYTEFLQRALGRHGCKLSPDLVILTVPQRCLFANNVLVDLRFKVTVHMCCICRHRPSPAPTTQGIPAPTTPIVPFSVLTLSRLVLSLRTCADPAH